MIKWFIYCFLLVFAFAACEQIYTPETELRESVLVADARIVVGKTDNFIKLYESRNFNDESYKYPDVSGAKVWIIDNNGDEIRLNESRDGIFPVSFSLNPDLAYKIRIEYLGNTFESNYEPVPKIPELDTVYGVAGTKFIKQGGNNDPNDIREISGIQLYTDILNEKELPFYRFSARNVLQYVYTVEVVVMGEIMPEPMYAWLSTYPKEIFNIASPPEFSYTNKIVKHPLFFMVKKLTPLPDQTFAGWILILNQYRLSESGYNFYNDLNKQLGSEGRLFDPVYVQARNNMKCVNDSKQLILGNFEISSFKEHRYFVKFISDELGYVVKRIPYYYEIPPSGEQISTPPDFWEYESKTYPDEK